MRICSCISLFQKAYSHKLIVKAHPDVSGLHFVAERVGFEPTCPALNETNRFRVDPVTTTSVPLLFVPSFSEKTLHKVSTLMFHYARYYCYFVIKPFIIRQIVHRACSAPLWIKCPKNKGI